MIKASHPITYPLLNTMQHGITLCIRHRKQECGVVEYLPLTLDADHKSTANAWQFRMKFSEYNFINFTYHVNTNTCLLTCQLVLQDVLG
jgi:hypothetical protein